MPLVENFKFENKIPKQTQKWSLEERCKAWSMYVDGHSLLLIARELGRTEKSISRFIENQIDFYEAHSDTKYNGNRTGFSKTWIDNWMLRRGKKLPIEMMAQLLGRSVKDMLK